MVKKMSLAEAIEFTYLSNYFTKRE